LMTGLGLLVQPIRQLVYTDGDVAKRIPYVRHEWEHAINAFSDQASRYCVLDGIPFTQECAVIIGHARRIGMMLGSVIYPEHRQDDRRTFEHVMKEAQAAIRAMPCEDIGVIVPAETPYTAYLLLRRKIRAAVRRVELLDPWLDSPTFDRYLPDIPTGIDIVVVTSADIMDFTNRKSSKRGEARRDRIVAVSDLLAGQYPSNYRFLVSGNIHDRHMRIDDAVYHLGGSLKDAATVDPYTISTMEENPGTAAVLDSMITAAIEWYGPNVKPHRRQ
jgi:hypothetical protein